MNWGRGLFRLWTVLLGLWSILWVLIGGAWLNNTVLNGTVFLSRDCQYSTSVSVAATDVDVKAAVEASAKTERARSYCAQGPWNRYASYGAISDFHAELERRPAQLWNTFFVGLAVWAIPPAILFALGAAILWALNGFRKSQ